MRIGQDALHIKHTNKIPSSCAYTKSITAIATEDAAGPNGSTATPEDDESNSGYRLPPAEIRDIVDAPPLPALSFSPQRDKILFLKRRSLPPLSELAKPEDKLAGVRIDGKSNTRSRMSFYTGIGIHDLRDDGTLGPEKLIHGFPDGSKLNFVTWSTDGRHLAFSIRGQDQEEEDDVGSKLRVWVADVETGKAKPLFQSPDVFLNAIFDNYVWVNDSTLLVCTIPASRGKPPKKPTLCDLPVAEDIPIAFNSVRKGMRSLNWRADKPSTLYWVETQDGGDAKVEVSPRDIVYTQAAEEE
ncbi:unnamed protein product [Lactuca virosa]|uniref:Peptidase S9A N-terminal domain-containing protein n=1 Tax=Lactuca virosa TaxID=75947 RepID=A0AAU9PTM2_9ASTR|nr:unnamed protein product [Lactuca virosa]